MVRRTKQKKRPGFKYYLIKQPKFWGHVSLCLLSIVSFCVVVLGLLQISYASTIPAQSAGKAGLELRHWTSSSMSYAINNAAKFRVIMLNSWEASYIPQLKAKNPSIKVLVYKDLSSTRDYACHGGVDDSQLPTGVGYCYANTHHPEWFLKDSDNNRLKYSGYSGHWQMDIGNSAYQTAWANNVKADLQDGDWDGVVMDNALFRADTYHNGVLPASYPSDSSFQTAYKSMLATVTPVLRNAGFISIANMADARLYSGQWSAYGQYLDGGYDEFWMVFAPGNYDSDYGSKGWSAQMSEVTSMENQGKLVVLRAQTNGTDTTGALYAYANYLLANGGHTVIDEGSSSDSVNPATTNWPARDQYSWDLGSPSDDYFSLGNSVYRRNFSKGIVIVNANSGSYSTTVELNDSYLNESGSKVTSVTLAARHAAILRTIPSTTEYGGGGSSGSSKSGSGKSQSSTKSSTASETVSTGDSSSTPNEQATTTESKPINVFGLSIANPLTRLTSKSGRVTLLIVSGCLVIIATGGLVLAYRKHYHLFHFGFHKPLWF